jgi:hypothetical protein
VRSEIWGYRDVALGGVGLVGFDVEATDGPVGKVDGATHEVGGFLVVGTRSRIFNRKVAIPANAVARVDAAAGVIFLDRDREAILAAPQYRAGRTSTAHATIDHASQGRRPYADGKAQPG